MIKNFLQKEILSEITIREVGGSTWWNLWKDFWSSFRKYWKYIRRYNVKSDNKLAIEETVSLSIDEIKEK